MEQAPRQKPYLLRLVICLLSFVAFLFLGYGIYIFGQIQLFISSSTGQKVSFKASVTQTQPLPSYPNQSNILLLGSDNDQKFTGNPLTQTMMIIHINYDKKEIDMFSIPRDLWVRMPGRNTYGKIDQAAEYEGIPSAIAVVEQTFGIPIDHYAWVGLYGFIKSIDAIGGVNLQVVHPVLDNAYPTDINTPNPYGYQRLDILPGFQHMNGEQALQYVRSRHEDLIGDFGRTQRQRQLLLTIKQTLLSTKSPLLSFPKIFASLNGQVKTDLTSLSALQLGAFYIAHKDSITVSQYTLSPPLYSQIGNSIDGQSIVIGNATGSAKLMAKIFNDRISKITYNSLVSVKDIQQ